MQSTTTQMHLNHTMPVAKKFRSSMIPLMSYLEGQVHRGRDESGGCQVARAGEGSMNGWCFMGTVSIWEDESPLQVAGGNGCTKEWICSAALGCPQSRREDSTLNVTYAPRQS